MQTRVLLADDQAIFLHGLRVLLRRRGYRIVAEARDGTVAVRYARQQKPDLAVLELGLASMNGFEAAREISRVSPRTRVIFLTVLGTEHRVLQALRDGVRGVVLKTQPPEDLFRAMHEVLEGGIYVAPALSAAVLSAIQAIRSSAGETITRRERQVLQLVAEGKRTKEIAALLRISAKTASFHRSRIMQRLNIHDTVGLVRFAVRHGFVTP